MDRIIHKTVCTILTNFWAYIILQKWQHGNRVTSVAFFVAYFLESYQLPPDRVISKKQSKKSGGNAKWKSIQKVFMWNLNRVISLHTRISNNLNQYAKKANEMGKLYEEDIAEIKMMNNEQAELLKKALEAVIHLYEEDSKKRKWIDKKR